MPAIMSAQAVPDVEEVIQTISNHCYCVFNDLEEQAFNRAVSHSYPNIHDWPSSVSFKDWVKDEWAVMNEDGYMSSPTTADQLEQLDWDYIRTEVEKTNAGDLGERWTVAVERCRPAPAADCGDPVN